MSTPVFLSWSPFLFWVHLKVKDHFGWNLAILYRPILYFISHHLYRICILFPWTVYFILYKHTSTYINAKIWIKIIGDSSVGRALVWKWYGSRQRLFESPRLLSYFCFILDTNSIVYPKNQVYIQVLLSVSFTFLLGCKIFLT